MHITSRDIVRDILQKFKGEIEQLILKEELKESLVRAIDALRFSGIMDGIEEDIKSIEAERDEAYNAIDKLVRKMEKSEASLEGLIYDILYQLCGKGKHDFTAVEEIIIGQAFERFKSEISE